MLVTLRVWPLSSIWLVALLSLKLVARENGLSFLTPSMRRETGCHCSSYSISARWVLRSTGWARWPRDLMVHPVALRVTSVCSKPISVERRNTLKVVESSLAETCGCAVTVTPPSNAKTRVKYAGRLIPVSIPLTADVDDGALSCKRPKSFSRSAGMLAAGIEH